MTLKCILYFLLLHSAALHAQPTLDSVLRSIDPNKLSTSLEKQLSRLEGKISYNSGKILERLQKQEEKIYEKQFTTKDSLVAKLKLAEVKNKYDVLAKKLKSPSSLIAVNIRHYIPRLDTITSMLKFLDQNKTAPNFKNALSKIESLNDKLQLAMAIGDFISERRAILQQELEQLGLIKQLNIFNKKIFYYSERIKECKEMLSDRPKIEERTMELLCTTKAFRDFMRKNSMLTSLFRLPVDPNDPVSMAGLVALQTRVDVNNLIQQQFGSDAPKAQAQFRQNIRHVEAQMQQRKNKLMQFDGGSSDDIMPYGFKPNNQKTKSFLKRLEYGVNIQAQRATSFFPATTDLGLSIGYKVNDNSIIGVGASYKAGVGRGWNEMKLSSQGVGLRSYIDWKAKGNIWISGGFEMNYRSQLRGIQISSPFGRGQEGSEWQQSGLIGLSKVIDVKAKFFKKTKLQLVWDFLSRQQIPRTQPFIFRIGYNLK
ncbi:MAG TPA: hypothetical protein VGQ53_21715 [Chitinophagaceae bacterium]|nr:hypothetical protein [Chitinophagaceae bacterium]